MRFTIYAAAASGDPKNCRYPNKHIITDEATLKAATIRDYVCAEYKDNYRSSGNFLASDCLGVDCDNDVSDDPYDWVTPLDVSMAFTGVEFAVHYSRNNEKEKDGRAARPKFHILFPIDRTTDAKEYANLKKRVNEIFPYFDTKALDAARFFFGTAEPKVEIYRGKMNLTEFLRGAEAATPAHGSFSTIPQGCRNSTMSRFAGRVVKRYGATSKAHEIFLSEAQKCQPPLEDEELSTIWQSACRFAKKVAKEKGYIPPDQYNDEFKPVSLKPDDYSDIGQAKIIAREYGDELKYTDATEFLRYDGKAWVESLQRSVGAVEEFLDLQLQDAKDTVNQTADALAATGVDETAIRIGGRTLEKLVDENSLKEYTAYKAAKAYLAFVMDRRNMKYIVSAMKAAKPMLEMSPADFDKDAFLLNTPDGTFDLRKGLDGKREHKPEDYITKMTACAPSDKGKSEWLAAINLIFQGDAELIEYVQKIVGLAAIGSVYMEAMVISYGTGSNGKSTFWNAIAAVLNSYSGNVSADALTVGCKRNVKPELAEVKGKRLLIASELEEGVRLNTSVVKQLCSTDDIFAEKKYKSPFSFKPSHTLVLYTNHLPRVGAMDDGIWRRLIVIPFNAKITGGVKNYGEKLIAAASPYIMAWIIEGAKKAIDDGFKFKLPKVVEDAIGKYKSDNDWLTHFFDECCELGETFTEKSGELYQEYRAYCQRVGTFARSTTEFYNALDLRGMERKKTKTGSMVRGLRLLNTDF